MNDRLRTVYVWVSLICFEILCLFNAGTWCTVHVVVYGLVVVCIYNSMYIKSILYSNKTTKRHVPNNHHLFTSGGTYKCTLKLVMSLLLFVCVYRCTLVAGRHTRIPYKVDSYTIERYATRYN